MRIESLTFLTIFISLQLSHGYGTFRNQWVDHYDAGPNLEGLACQVCHVNTTGGSPWNAYGWLVRQTYRSNGFDIIQAFTAVESINADNSSDGSSNIEEITADTPPGWTSGNNTTFNKSGTPNSNQSVPANITITLDIPIDPYDAWIASFYPGESAANIIGKESDPNGDGIQNLLCFYLGTDPRETDCANTPNISFSGANLILTHQRNAVNASGITGGLEYNTDLGVSWNTAVDGENGVSIIISPADPITGIDVIQYSLPMPPEGRLFSRIVVQD